MWVILLYFMIMVNLYFFMMIVIKVLIFCFNFSGMALDVQAGTCSGWYWEEEYVEHVQNSLAQAADEALRKKLIDVEQTHDLSVLVGIGREILMLLKCILALVF